ncbi:hypothetical protein Agabi119p4_8634 [Agaricus bisporus var. burnettii]|nr:hypothetical protein Agabi119p4_8634 [Agaricus bisporus var. burnettii]
MKVPTVQYVKSFIVANPDVPNAFDASVSTFQDELLTHAIQLKTAEVNFLRQSIALADPEDANGASPAFTSLLERLNERFDSVHRNAKKAVFGPPTEETHGRSTFQGWVQDDSVVSEYAAFVADVPAIITRAIAIVDDALLAEETKAEKKRNLKESAMMDVDEHITAKSIQSTIDKRVAQLLSDKKGKSKAKVSGDSPNHRINTLLMVESWIALETGKACGKASESGGLGVEAEATRKRSREGTSREESQGTARRRISIEESEERFKGERQGELTVSSPALSLRDDESSFRWDHPLTYPDWLLTVPLHVAQRYIVARTPIVVLESLRYRATIHEIECSLPREIGLHLSVGFKYMLPTKFNTDLIWKAWDDFVDRLRWSCFWKAQALDGLEDDFDPDYYVRPISRKRCGPLDWAFEHGIKCGGRAIVSMVSQIPSDVQTGGSSTIRTPSPPVSVLKSYLTSHELVVLATDKNLGCAVAPRSWIVDKTYSLLNSELDYVELDIKDVLSILRQKVRVMTDLSQWASVKDVQPQLPDYFMSQLSEDEDDLLRHIPRFYVIPKIHKTPTAARPIIPCHSVVQGPAGKFVSKMLRPVIESAPFIIHGTKDLSLKLNKLSLPYVKLDNGVLKRLYIVSGDVVAFYPNVNVPLAHDCALAALAHWFSLQDNISVDKASEYLHLFRECLSAADDNLLCQFDGKYFKQKRGLAMGVASSPDLANLYGVWHELRSEVLKSPDVAFYGRYIDDVLALVYATSETNAVNLLREGVQFTDCTLTWSASNQFMPFLDMTLYFDKSKRLQWKPYRKPLNHFERIPWISSHPLYVKKGTFIGELSRMATLSSQFDDFADACKEVADIYIARGYPPMLIANWLKQNYQTRWDTRLRETSPPRADVLVLKSEYNISWDFFNVRKLEEQMKNGWLEALRVSTFGRADTIQDLHPAVSKTKFKNTVLTDLRRNGGTLPPGSEFHPSMVGEGAYGQFYRLDKLGLLDRRFLVSKKRTTEIIDLAAAWRKSVLTRHDRQVVKVLHRKDDTDRDPSHQTTLDMWLNI